MCIRDRLYSVWYMATDPRGAVFQAIVSMFGAAMLLVVLSGDLLLTLIGWEVMGWGSYLLIGHHTFRRSARRAAMKAFLLTRFADIGFVLGIVALAAQTGTTRLAVIFEHFGEGAAAPTAALVLMLIGIAGTVSYTHLDVYKRQDQGYDTFDWLSAVDRMYVAPAAEPTPAPAADQSTCEDATGVDLSLIHI